MLKDSNSWFRLFFNMRDKKLNKPITGSLNCVIKNIHDGFAKQPIFHLFIAFTGHHPDLTIEWFFLMLWISGRVPKQMKSCYFCSGNMTWEAADTDKVKENMLKIGFNPEIKWAV